MPMITPTLQAQDNLRARRFLKELCRTTTPTVAPLIDCLGELSNDMQMQFAVCCVRFKDELETKRGRATGWGPATVAELMWDLIRGGWIPEGSE